MASRVASYMRTHRRRWALSQKELARLLGVSHSQVSRWERLERKPKLSIVLKYQAIFGVLPHEMLPHSYGVARLRVRIEARRLLNELESTETPSAKRKKKLLQRLLETARDD